MTLRCTILCLAVAGLIPLRAADDAPSPFSTVIVRGNVLVVTLAHNHEWHVAEGSGATRLASEGESLQFRDEELIFIGEPHHAIYRLRCRLSPPPAGVQVESRVEAGHSPFEKKYFIKAQ
jgi:hypothetical protein